MADIQTDRESLRALRARQDEARRQVLAASDALAGLKSERAAHSRRADSSSAEAQAARQVLDRRIAAAEDELARMRTARTEAGRAELEALGTLTAFADPRQAVGELSDACPLLLLPVRLETRFRRISVAGVMRNQLWVRVFPDECAVDGFEAVLSDKEVSNARVFWSDYWRALGDEGRERAAWRAFVASQGVGRAGWTLRNYRPVNEAEKPATAGDVLLRIVTDLDMSAAERTAARDYWSAVYRRPDDAAAEVTARNALAGAVGDAARATQIVGATLPTNLGEEPPAPRTRADARLESSLLQFPPSDTVPTKRRSWTEAARCEIFPERFVLVGMVSGARVFEVVGAPVPPRIFVSPDPTLGPDEQLKVEGGDLRVPPALRWLTDFDTAVSMGLGFRVDLDDAVALSGLDRLFVIGVRVGATEQESAQQLETLLEHHFHSSRGFSLIRQGTPTNNTEAAPSGFTRSEDADGSFQALVKGAAPLTVSADPAARLDGAALATALGIRPEVLAPVPNAQGRDQIEAHAMNVALWPATFGYMLESMLAPLIDAETRENCRRFFCNYVSGRGAIPAVRVGAQPYGILPVAAFSRAKWFDKDRIDLPGHLPGGGNFLGGLYRVLRRMDAHWQDMSRAVTQVGQGGDAHAILLDVLGLHAGSVEYHQRWAESAEELFNRAQLAGFGEAMVAAMRAAFTRIGGTMLLEELGAAGGTVPPILEKFFEEAHNLLQGPLVDDRPLSESEPIRAWTDDGRNYLQWLEDAARSSLETLRLQDGFSGDRAPPALLYLLLRHALLLSYWDTSLKVQVNAGRLTTEREHALRREANFVHVAGERSESRWNQLYVKDSTITGSADRTLAEHITAHVSALPQAAALEQQLRALAQLRDTPTARLERLFAEHVDCASYRLDAWLHGACHVRLETLRAPGATSPRRGVHLGAYGWLENVRPKTSQAQAVQLGGELAGIFDAAGPAPLTADSSNAGFIHAPSINQAITGAILRNGYLSNADSANREAFAVNLTSERVRVALGILEGIRGGQSLGALLGYRFERGLHDRHGLAEVDEFIFDLRKAFPLRADQLASTRTDADVPIEAIEARNVLDGFALVGHVIRTGNRNYPFGLTLPAASEAQRAAIDAEVSALIDARDAVADLGITESVYQAVQGNFERAAGTLDSFSRGQFPPEPDVVRTPRSGITITNRAGLHFTAGLDAEVSPIAGLAVGSPGTELEFAL